MPIKKLIEYDINNKQCFICTSHAKTIDGYIKIKIKGKDKRLHRVVLEEKLGRPIKEGYCACHTCDNTSCINPDHLFEGTVLDNNTDCINKGRHRYGTKFPQRYFIAISYTGENFICNNQNKFAKEHNLDVGAINKCLKGTREQHKGYKFTYT